MADVACPNPDCDEYQIPKTNPGGFPPSMIRCGQCGGPITELAAGEPTPGEPSGEENPPEPPAEPTEPPGEAPPG